MLRRCCTCGLHKAATEFHRDASRLEGLSYHCKLCDQARTKAYRKKTGRRGTVNRVANRAHVRVKSALKRGLLQRLPCEICGSETVEAHHDDYTKPLEVRWLCLEHHRAWHREHGPGRNLLEAAS